MKSVLDARHFHDEAAAYRFVEERVWPEGPVCPHCGGVDRISAMKGKSTRLGMYKCYQCRKPFRVTVGTVFEASHVPLRLWLQAMFLMASSKKGISSNQLHRTLGVTLKTAWFMSHRLREAMRAVHLEPMGGAGSIVEIDETASGKQQGHAGQKGWSHMNTVLTLVERGGSARSFHVEGTGIAHLLPIIRANVAKESAIMTDSASWYKHMISDAGFASHDKVDHGAHEYVRYGGERLVHTNTVEGFYSIFKRGMKGIYQHCGERHLHRYIAEFDFRYSNRVKVGFDDIARADKMLKGIVGKRLTYRTTN